jgi:hypothetical protein
LDSGKEEPEDGIPSVIQPSGEMLALSLAATQKPGLQGTLVVLLKPFYAK